MGGGGGKGGSQTQQVEIPGWISAPASRNLKRAEMAQKIPYMPYYGADVAAFTPTQEAAMQGQYDTAAAFGLAPRGGDVMAGMPQAKQYAGGFMGYSSAPQYEQALAELRTRNPEAVAQYNKLFV